MRQIEFSPDHLTRITVQPDQSEEIRQGEIRVLSQLGVESYTWVDGEKIKACAGIAKINNEHVAWAILSRIGPKDFLRMHRDVVSILNAYAEDVVAYVDWGFYNARRWMRLLGFVETSDYGTVNGIRYIKCVRRK